MEASSAEVASDEHDPRPVVRLARQGLSGGIIGGVAVLLAVVLFVILNGQRQQGAVATERTTSGIAFTSPPPLAVPNDMVSEVSPPGTIVVTRTVPVAPPLRNEPDQSMPSIPPYVVPFQPAPFSAPSEPYAPPPVAPARSENLGTALIYDIGGAPALAVTSASPSANSGANREGTRTGAGGGGGTASGADDVPVRATTMRSRTDVVPVGTMVPIVLETPIDTARPGLVRAIASRDTRGFDGRRILIPRGSRFIGEYQADVRSGQNRVLVTWTRVIRPDGVTIRLGSPAADQLGGSGVPGKVNSFFLQRFAGAVLQSALNVGVNLASRPRAGSVVVGIPTGPITTVGQGLIPNDYRPKITVRQGEALNVFVARDLDFSGFPAGQR